MSTRPLLAACSLPSFLPSFLPLFFSFVCFRYTVMLETERPVVLLAKVAALLLRQNLLAHTADQALVVVRLPAHHIDSPADGIAALVAIRMILPVDNNSNDNDNNNHQKKRRTRRRRRRRRR
jgi:hypothetical protein